MRVLKDVVGIGNAIVDVLAGTDEALLEQLGLAKGSMTLVDVERVLELHRRMGPGVERSGGSAANTMVGLASLGGSGAYIGKVRDDVLGEVFRREIRAAGVGFDTPPADAGPPTARCLIFVTPDAQRTMQTFLGASATLGPEDIDPRTVQDAGIVFLEGYLFDPPPAKQAFLKAAEIAHAAGRKVSLTLSDPFCVERHRAEFLQLVERHVDILFANELEIKSLFEEPDFDRAVAMVRGRCEVAVITRGALGSCVVAGDAVCEIDAERVDPVVDSTGAGDLYASGFLYGLARGRDLYTCARIGGIAAAEILKHYGARPEVSLAEAVRARLG